MKKISVSDSARYLLFFFVLLFCGIITFGLISFGLTVPFYVLFAVAFLLLVSLVVLSYKSLVTVKITEAGIKNVFCGAALGTVRPDEIKYARLQRSSARGKDVLAVYVVLSGEEIPFQSNVALAFDPKKQFVIRMTAKTYPDVLPFLQEGICLFAKDTTVPFDALSTTVPRGEKNSVYVRRNEDGVWEDARAEG